MHSKADFKPELPGLFWFWVSTALTIKSRRPCDKDNNMQTNDSWKEIILLNSWENNWLATTTNKFLYKRNTLIFGNTNILNLKLYIFK